MQDTTIARTVGAITYRSLADWGKVAAARQAYAASGGDDWAGEFKRLAQEPGAFRAELIVISEGPYSNVSASETPYGEQEWTRIEQLAREGEAARDPFAFLIDLKRNPLIAY